MKPLSYYLMLERAKNCRKHALKRCKWGTQESTDYEKLVADFQSNYKILEAAGGLVYNAEGKILLIFRRDFWDLPKGKIDPGESKAAAAVREVEEETGLKDITLGDLITETYHTYRTKKGNRILKRTYWFRMDAPNQE